MTPVCRARLPLARPLALAVILFLAPAFVPGALSQGHTLFDTPGGSLRILNRGQFRFTHESPDEGERLGGGEPGEGRGTFRIRRAKTELTGWIWHKDLTYELQLSWAGPEPGNSTQTPLEDAILTWHVGGRESLRISAGQFKVPLGRQEMTSSGYLQFIDRDLLSVEFTRGRDIGIMADGHLRGGRLQYMAGVFNGNPASRAGNENEKYQYNARITWNPWGPVLYREGDFESKDRPLLAVGAQFEHNDRHGTSERVNDFRTTILGADVVLKYRGASLFAEYFGRHRDLEVGPSYRSDGWHAQAGYFLVKGRLEAAARHARFDPGPAAEDGDVKETGLALNYFVRKHTLKVQGDVRRLDDGSRGTRSHEARLQTQIMF